jgi:hypothetical protein
LERRGEWKVEQWSCGLTTSCVIDVVICQSIHDESRQADREDAAQGELLFLAKLNKVENEERQDEYCDESARLSVRKRREHLRNTSADQFKDQLMASAV